MQISEAFDLWAERRVVVYWILQQQKKKLKKSGRERQTRSLMSWNSKGGQVTIKKKQNRSRACFQIKILFTKNFQAHYGVNKNTDDGQEAWPKAPELYSGYYIASYWAFNVPSITA